MSKDRYSCTKMSIPSGLRKGTLEIETRLNLKSELSRKGEGEEDPSRGINFFYVHVPARTSRSS